MVAAEVCINEDEDAEPSIEILRADIEHELVRALDKVSDCEHDGGVVRLSWIRHKLREDLGYVLAVDVHDLCVVTEEVTVLPELLWAYRLVLQCALCGCLWAVSFRHGLEDGLGHRHIMQRQFLQVLVGYEGINLRQTAPFHPTFTPVVLVIVPKDGLGAFLYRTKLIPEQTCCLL